VCLVDGLDRQVLGRQRLRAVGEWQEHQVVDARERDRHLAGLAASGLARLVLRVYGDLVTLVVGNVDSGRGHVDA
jgi:hypothetical protein